MGGVPIIRCSECPRLLADAATARRQRGLPQRSPYSATCSERCEEHREARFRREARERGYPLEPGEWRCDQCGCTAAEAMTAGPRKLSAKMVVCSAECARARLNRRTAALMREKQRTPKDKQRRKAWVQSRARARAGPR